VSALAGKVAVITGASRGIGRATAERLARDGASVVINYAVSDEQAKAVVNEIEARAGKAIAIQADIARLDDIARLFRETVVRLGRLDILVANAGYACFKPFAETTEEDFDRTYALNAKGTYFCLKEALRHMTDGGRIVCVSTIGTVLNPPAAPATSGARRQSSNSAARSRGRLRRAESLSTSFRRALPRPRCCSRTSTPRRAVT
jgi:3-oxoacyl-[acyl-carrier protein] reductase